MIFIQATIFLSLKNRACFIQILCSEVMNPALMCIENGYSSKDRLLDVHKLFFHPSQGSVSVLFQFDGDVFNLWDGTCPFPFTHSIININCTIISECS